MYGASELVDDIKHVSRLQLSIGQKATLWLLKHPERFTDATRDAALEQLRAEGWGVKIEESKFVITVPDGWE